MSTPQENAAKIRQAAETLAATNLYTATVRNLHMDADLIDPPVPVYPDGTVARGTGIASGRDYRMVRANGWWMNLESGFTAARDEELKEIRVIPTVPEGHRTYDPTYAIAIRRTGHDAVQHRSWASEARDYWDRSLHNYYARALEAEPKR